MKETTHTHIGHRKESGSECQHIRSGRRNLGDGQIHALNATDGCDRWYAALCGVRVSNERTDMYGDPIAPNVSPISEVNARRVTCARCSRLAKSSSGRRANG